MITPVNLFLDRHLQAKLANRDWLTACSKGDQDAFPYRPVEKGTAMVLRPFSPLQPATQVTPPADASPLFLVNIPVANLPSQRCDPASLLRRFRDESFGTTPRASAVAVKNRLAVVLGINQIKSIDPEMNRIFKASIQGLSTSESVVNRCIGFLWSPEWKAQSKGVYPLKKAFLLLKALFPEQAQKVRKAHEQPKGLAPALVSQIPFQQIRQTIKDCRATRALMGRMEAAAPQSPIYYTTMDADCLSLRPTRRQEGIFSRLGKLIAKHGKPSIASPGYSLNSDEAPLLRLAVNIDMAVRATMPAPYFPEPCTAYKVRNASKGNFLSSMSFIGPGKGLESRRFIENGRALLTDGAVLEPDGGVVTTTPGRMKTVYNQKIRTLTPAILKAKSSLQALRGRTIQTHAFPKQWADIFYAGLPSFSCSQVTKATAPMMRMFNVYHPISRMFAAKKYTPAVFDRTMKNYDNPLTNKQKSALKTAETQLRKLNMGQQTIDLLKKTAKDSGRAIYQLLKKAVAAR